jgi:hypothetical protein
VTTSKKPVWAAARAAQKGRYTQLAKFHEEEAQRWLKKADDRDVMEFAPQPSAGQFGGL